MQPAEATAKEGVPKGFRRLQGHELVTVGDFVQDEQLGLELWEGPSGFRADAFVKAMYRQVHSRPSVSKV